MANFDYQFLQEKILEFIAVIETCLKSTTYADDRPVYLSDIASAASWLIKLHKGAPPVEVAREIISPKTDKQFGDYWRQGDCGDREAKALKNLQDHVKKYYSL
jgi:hypothetical protein